MTRSFWRHSLVALLAAASLLGPLAVRAEAPPVTVAAQADTSSIAARIVELTNQTRKENGVGTTVTLSYLASAAVGHSQEMVDLKYFSHTSPTPALAQPKQRVQQSRGWDTRVGENIYKAKGIPAAALAERAMAAWIKSPSHFKNLVDPTFNSTGLGIVATGDEFTITQMFSNQTIVVRKMQASPASGGFKMTFQGEVREGNREGALFVNNAFKAPFQADASGRFELQATVPARAQVSVSQKKSSTSYAQNLAFPIEAATDP